MRFFVVAGRAVVVVGGSLAFILAPSLSLPPPSLSLLSLLLLPLLLLPLLLLPLLLLPLLLLPLLPDALCDFFLAASSERSLAPPLPPPLLPSGKLRA